MCAAIRQREHFTCRSLLLEGFVAVHSISSYLMCISLHGNRNLIQCLSVWSFLFLDVGLAWLSQKHSYMDFFLKEASDSLKRVAHVGRCSSLFQVITVGCVDSCRYGLTRDNSLAFAVMLNKISLVLCVYYLIFAKVYLTNTNLLCKLKFSEKNVYCAFKVYEPSTIDPV